MFSLTEEDLSKNILGCGDGPSSFNAELTRRGGRVTSIDPLYQFSENEIRARINNTYAEVLEQTGNNSHQFRWTRVASIESLSQIRMGAMEEFLSDFPVGCKEGRYRVGKLPALPFNDNEFQLALCSHLLFLYSDHFSLKFHVNSIIELGRVSSETRIFPLVDLSSKKSTHLEETIRQLEAKGLDGSVERVPYEFQKGGNEMLIVKSK